MKSYSDNGNGGTMSDPMAACSMGLGQCASSTDIADNVYQRHQL